MTNTERMAVIPAVGEASPMATPSATAASHTALAANTTSRLLTPTKSLDGPLATETHSLTSSETMMTFLVEDLAASVARSQKTNSRIRLRREIPLPTWVSKAWASTEE